MMKKTTFTILMLVLMLGTIFGVCFSASAAEELQVYVKNKRTGAPIDNAIVFAVNANNRSLSFIIPHGNGSGLYARTFKFEEIDRYTIVVSAPGFSSESKIVDVLGITKVYFYLRPAAGNMSFMSRD